MLTLFLLLSGWHRATPEECRIETQREYAEMARMGLCCDPPMTMGMLVGGIEKGHRPYMDVYEPCAWTDGKGHFRGERRVTINPWRGTTSKGR